jgi:hypothetical protein
MSVFHHKSVDILRLGDARTEVVRFRELETWREGLGY